MADPIFEHPRLVAIYDYFDGKRDDLDFYLELAKNYDASSILDVGSGTGSFAISLAKQGFTVTGLEPAQASLDFAMLKERADEVNWIQGDASDLPEMQVDIAFMTGNVAQVFIEDDEWTANLEELNDALVPDGHLIFEVRDPAQKAWENWTRQKTHKTLNIPVVGKVEGWCELKEVSDEKVSFIWHYYFHSDQQTKTSKSTLRFRQKDDIVTSLNAAGFAVRDIKDAPDRPKQEFVFVAQKER